MDQPSKRRWRPAGAVAASMIGGLLLAACGGNGVTPPNNATLTNYNPLKGTPGGQLIFSDWEPVQDLNVLGSSAATTQQVASGPIWASLWVFDGQNKPIPDLVAQVPLTDNGLVRKLDDTHMDVTIKLRPGLKWSDGSPLTSADLTFTVDAICDPNTNAATTLGFDHITSQEVKDSQTVVWHFGPNKSGTCGLSSDLQSGIYAPYLTLNTPLVPKSVLGSIPHQGWGTSDYFTKKPAVTSGPYMVQDFSPGPSAIVTLVPNPNYGAGRASGTFFNHAPYLNKLTYKIYGDKSSQIAGLKSADTDLGLDLIAKDLPALQGSSSLHPVYANGLLDEFVNFNLGNNSTGCQAQQYAATCGTATPWQSDKSLRQAIALSIDKDAMNQQLVGGIGKTMNSFMVSTLAPYYDKSTPPFRRDVARANQMLDQDGWVKGSDGIRVKNGHRLAWTISTTSGNPQRAAEEELLISNWKDIGAQVSTKNFPAGIFFQNFQGGGINATGQFDMTLYANNWAPDPDTWASSVLPGQIPSAQNPAGLNWNRANDPKLTDLMTQGENTIDISQRAQIYQKAQAEWRDYLPTIELYERPDVFGVGAAFGNFTPTVNTCLATCTAPDWFHKGVS
jgi:peptide/nickel transport system substrate-binding protein